MDKCPEGLKSDHFGIEMKVFDEMDIVNIILKSDHFGIEIRTP